MRKAEHLRGLGVTCGSVSLHRVQFEPIIFIPECCNKNEWCTLVPRVRSGSPGTCRVWSRGLTCRLHGSTPGLGPGPQAAGATWAAAHCGGRAAAAPLRSGRAGAGPQGAGPADDHGQWLEQDTQGNEILPVLDCSLPRTLSLGEWVFF